MSFYGLNIAKSGVFVAQTGLTLTGHNISNVQTAGYTRQRLVVESIEPAAMMSRFANVANNRHGHGARIQVIDQIRSSFVDKELRREYADMGAYSAREETLIYLESIFNETGDASVSNSMKDFFDALQALTQDNPTLEQRTNVQQSAQKMCESFNHYYTQLRETQMVQNDSIKQAVDDVNDIITSIADFNKQIALYELSGEKANDLRDKRNLLLDELSIIMDIEYTYDVDGYLSITVGGDTLVSHTDVTRLTAVPQGAGTDEPDFYRIYVGDPTDDNKLNFTSGELSAYFQLRDGADADNIGIPYFINNMNKLVQSLAQTFNEIHVDGWTYPNGTDASRQGILFFDVESYQEDDGNGNMVTKYRYEDITAGNFKISADIKDPDKGIYNIAISSEKIDLAAGNPQEGNNEIARELAKLSSRSDIPVIGSYEGFLKKIVLDLAIESGHVQKLASGQSSVVSNLESRKESISGVSIDEEVVNMMEYQHMYSACSRMITAIDEALDVLINRTGLVGRS